MSFLSIQVSPFMCHLTFVRNLVELGWEGGEVKSVFLGLQVEGKKYVNNKKTIKGSSDHQIKVKSSTSDLNKHT
jgi:hypothetical protein